ncbi:hypothetical protein, partial [Candidatus Nitrotoga fabula]|uniref:hypothetical protein n=1 Tax=Candidatus Nitrotoga fabula TaxID=2182327 RepID=UPI001BB48366
MVLSSLIPSKKPGKMRHECPEATFGSQCRKIFLDCLNKMLDHPVLLCIMRTSCCYGSPLFKSLQTT